MKNIFANISITARYFGFRQQTFKNLFYIAVYTLYIFCYFCSMMEDLKLLQQQRSLEDLWRLVEIRRKNCFEVRKKEGFCIFLILASTKTNFSTYFLYWPFHLTRLGSCDYRVPRYSRTLYWRTRKWWKTANSEKKILSLKWRFW